MRISRYSFSYSFTFALINFAEATVQLACLGLWSPCWVMTYASNHVQRELKNKQNSS